jgi:hypothetical protein
MTWMPGDFSAVHDHGKDFCYGAKQVRAPPPPSPHGPWHTIRIAQEHSTTLSPRLTRGCPPPLRLGSTHALKGVIANQHGPRPTRAEEHRGVAAHNLAQLPVASEV